jgi:CRP-like cAMP-binding protein
MLSAQSTNGAEMGTRRRYGANEVILREGDLGQTAYIVRSGAVEVTSRASGEPVCLATLGPGETFGEMSLVDDKPRSATVTALEPTELEEIHQDGFFESLQTDPGVAIDLLRALFERLREPQSRLLRLERERGGGERVADAPPSATPGAADIVLELRGLTDEADLALPVSPLEIRRFPFRVGRQSHNPLVHNDLSLQDAVPWQLSRHHLALVVEGGRVGVLDRGSHLGTGVDGQRLGGRTGEAGPIFFAGPRGELVLGDSDSPFRYEVAIRVG